MKHLCRLCLLLLVAVTPGYALTQPDISAIGDFRTFTGNWKTLEGEETVRNGNLNIRFQELELVLGGYLNPYTRGDVTVANHGDGFEIEEAYVSFVRGLPFKIEARAGRYLVDFGKLNTYHPHAYPFLDRPMSQRVFFGDEGFLDEGINASILLPLPFYSKLSANVLKGGIFGGGHHHEEEELALHEEEEGRGTEDPIYSGRLSSFFDLTDRSNLEIGFSGMYGMYQKNFEEGLDDLYAAMWSVDAKFKHRWNDRRSLTLHGEFMNSLRDIHAEVEDLGIEVMDDVSTWGAFGFVDLQFAKRYNIGVMVDYAPGIFDNGEHDYDPGPGEELSNTPLAAFDDQNRTLGISGFAGFSLLEETTVIRLLGRYTTFDIKDPSRLVNTALTEKDDEFTLVLQVLWSLGPHKPHQF